MAHVQVGSRRAPRLLIDGASRPLQAGCAALLLGGAPVLGHAQTVSPNVAPPPLTRGEIEQLRGNPQAGRTGPGAVVTLPAPPPLPCPFTGNKLSFDFTNLTLEGVSAREAARLEDVWRPELGKRITVEEICRLRDEISTRLFKEGLLARVEIPPQTIEGGRLQLEVITAWVRDVRVDAKGPDAGELRAIGERLRGMRPFNMQQAQRYFLLMGDVAGGVNRIRPIISASPTGEQGAVDIDIRVSPAPGELTARLDNEGQKLYGRWGVQLRGDDLSVPFLGGRASGFAYKSAGEPHGDQVIYYLGYIRRLTGEGLGLRLTGVYSDTRAGGPVSVLDLRGQARQLSGELFFPSIRSASTNVTWTGTLDYNEEQTFVFGVFPLIRERTYALGLRIDGSHSTTLFGRPVTFSGQLQLRKDVSGPDATKAGDFLLATPDANPRAAILTLRTQTDIQLAPQWTLRARAEGQAASDPLVTVEKFTLGDRSIVRGYEPGAILGDDAIAGSLELMRAPFILNPNVHAQPYVFLDGGQVSNLGLLRGRTEVYSTGGGVRLFLPRAVVDLSVAQPFGPMTSQRKFGTEVLFTATFSLAPVLNWASGALRPWVAPFRRNVH